MVLQEIGRHAADPLHIGARRVKAAVVTALGSAPLFAEFDKPAVRGSERLVRVEVAAIKQLERGIVAGTHYSSPKNLPIVPGVDGVGRLDDGSRVYFMVQRRPFGAMAEYAPSAWTVPVPDDLDAAYAAAVVNPALAAWLPLASRGRLQKGETVLILGASGTAGRMAVRAARLLGAGRVVACGRRQDVLASLGADATIDLTLDPDKLGTTFAAVVAQKIGVIVDYVWGPPAAALIGAIMRPDLHADTEDAEIRYVSVGAMAGASIPLPSTVLRGSRLTIMGSGTGNFPPQPELEAIIAEIFRHAAAGRLPINLVRFDLAQVAEAWAPQADPDERRVLRVPQTQEGP